MLSVAKAYSEHVRSLRQFPAPALGSNCIRAHTTADVGTEIGHFFCCTFAFSFTVP